MAFALTHPVSRIRVSPRLARWRARHTLTPQQRANLYVSRMPPGVLKPAR
jgi:hypothetical protein